MLVRSMEDCNKKITTKKKSWNWEFSRLQLFFNQMKEVSYYHCEYPPDTTKIKCG